MAKADHWTIAGHVALGLMCFVWTGMGWHIVLTGGLYSTPRHSMATVYVDGLAATVMAFIFFSLAAVCTAIILNRVNAGRGAVAVSTAAILGLPLAYLAGGYA
jgi:hypothetical protein